MSRWILLLSLSCVATTALAEDKSEKSFTPLFDGKSLEGWTGALDGYRVEDGAIVCIAGGQGNLLTKKQFGDFVLRFEFRLTPGANNGLAIRSPMRAKGNLHLDGIELQILDDRAEKYAKLKPYQYHGSVYGVAPAKRGKLLPLSEWNKQEVTCQGSRVKVTLNGSVIVDTDLKKASTPKTLDGQEHPGLLRERGRLGFLGHGDRIDVRNVRIRELP